MVIAGMGASERVWAELDSLVEAARPSPWQMRDGQRVFLPDLELLERLLAVPLVHGANTRSGLPAKAVDVWVAAELRRAGFGADEVWPRPRRPRVLPREVAMLLTSLPRVLRDQVAARLETSSAGGAVSADASILGKAYYKQVDVLISQWARGPELLISTKRMDSSVSNNAFNRIEESYGDAYNLRGRHPLAAIGYMLVLRSTTFEESESAVIRLLDLVSKLGQDSGGYDATAVVVAEWDDPVPGISPVVRVLPGMIPSELSETLSVSRFFDVMIGAVLNRTPVDTHVRPRELLSGTFLPIVEDESRFIAD
jgi:hypothetical protein